EPFDADRVAERARVAFLALPHTASLAVVPALRERGVRVIDLSADYRLKDRQVYADWYGHEHTDASGLDEAGYGLPQRYRDARPRLTRRRRPRAPPGPHGPRHPRHHLRHPHPHRGRARPTRPVPLVLRPEPVRSGRRPPAGDQGLGLDELLRHHRPGRPRPDR